jgi:hypothetical protein
MNTKGWYRSGKKSNIGGRRKVKNSKRRLQKANMRERRDSNKQISATEIRTLKNNNSDRNVVKLFFFRNVAIKYIGLRTSWR